MTLHHIGRVIVICLIAATGSHLVTAPAAAQTAEGSKPAAPLKLNKFMKKPIASAATRVVKTRDGSYARVSIARRGKSKAAAAKAAETKVVEAQATPAGADATEAFAFHAATAVRVVSPDELNEIDLAAGAAPIVTTAVEVSMAHAQPAADMINADEFNAIDQAANSPRAASLDALNKQFAAPATDKEPTQSSWFQHMLLVLGGAFAAASAAVRLLIG